ncbi:hypothetical protein [Cupriavidus sp. EM10]|nr:hypothetical protein [Cupriavidus sp. EM10]
MEIILDEAFVRLLHDAASVPAAERTGWVDFVHGPVQSHAQHPVILHL